MEQSMIIPAIGKALDTTTPKAEKFDFTIKRTAKDTKDLPDEIARRRGELGKEAFAFQRGASLDFWKSTQNALEEINKDLRANNQLTIDWARSANALQKELGESMV